MNINFLDILKTPDPSIELRKLDEAGVLDSLLPELTALKGIDVIDGQKHKDNFEHTLQVLSQTAEVSDNPYLRLVAILHDCGKATTKRFDKEKNTWTFQYHEHISGKMVKGVFERFKLDKSNLEYVVKIVQNHGIPPALTKNDDVTESAIRRLITELGEYVDDLLLFCKCDITTSSSSKKERFRSSIDILHKRVDQRRNTDIADKWRPPIDGIFIMKELNIHPGHRLGKILNDIKAAIKSGNVADDFDSAYNYLHIIKDKY